MNRDTIVQVIYSALKEEYCEHQPMMSHEEDCVDWPIPWSNVIETANHKLEDGWKPKEIAERMLSDWFPVHWSQYAQRWYGPGDYED